MSDFYNLISDYYKEHTKAVERALLECIEVHLGRVPTNEEVARCGKRMIFCGHDEPKSYDEYRWNDVVLMRVIHPKHSGWNTIEIHKNTSLK